MRHRVGEAAWKEVKPKEAVRPRALDTIWTKIDTLWSHAKTKKKVFGLERWYSD